MIKFQLKFCKDVFAQLKIVPDFYVDFKNSTSKPLSGFD